MVLRFWAQDEQGNEVFSGSKEYGFNFTAADGFEPVMESEAKGRGYDYVLKPQDTTEETFSFPAPKQSGKLTLKATLTFIFIVPPPPETQNRIRSRIISRLNEARKRGDQTTVDAILTKEIPARMQAMNVLATTVSNITVATAIKELGVKRASGENGQRHKRLALHRPYRPTKLDRTLSDSVVSEDAFLTWMAMHTGLSKGQVKRGLLQLQSEGWR